LWLVFGNDSVLGEKPTDLQLDPDANLLRPPTKLRAMARPRTPRPAPGVTTL